MKRSELLSRILITVAIVGTVGTPLFFWARTPLIHAKIAENGGWNPSVIQANVDEPLRLRLTSDDVVHGFAVGQMNMEAVDVLPGKVTDLTLTFEKAGIYTFYCTRWCGLNHWRMRGTIAVSGSDSPELAPVPSYMTLDIDIDAPHPASIVPESKPSPTRGSQLAQDLLLASYTNIGYYRSHAPAQVFTDLRFDPALQSLTDAQIWDLVAYLWQSQVTPDALKEAERLYTQNCAACHGENGAGDGVFADDLELAGQASTQTMNSADMAMQTPADFTDPGQMLGASPALLQGKLLRGGMGTGMPMWGVLFDDEQTWNMVAFLYTFQFTEVVP